MSGAGTGVGGREERSGEGEDDQGEDEEAEKEQQEVAELATGLGLRFLGREEADGAEGHPDLAPLEEEVDRDRDAESGEGGEEDSVGEEEGHGCAGGRSDGCASFEVSDEGGVEGLVRADAQVVGFEA